MIQGTRIPVELILRKLSEGMSSDDLLTAYPRLLCPKIIADEYVDFRIVKHLRASAPFRIFGLIRIVLTEQGIVFLDVIAPDAGGFVRF